MKDIDRLKLYLNIPLEDESNGSLLQMICEESYEEVAMITGRSVEWLKDHPVGRSTAIKAAVVKYNRRGTEGMKTQTFAGSSESYIDGLEAEIKTQLKSLTVVKFL